MPADAVIQGSIDPPAIIGKLPGHGDFLAQGVEFALREPIDRWMSEWIEIARQELGESFEEAYATAAPWLFESERFNAVLMPSVDSVGRLFPVLAACSARVRTQAIYDTLIAALEGAMKADALREELGELAQEDAPPGTELVDWFLPEGADATLPSPNSAASWPSIREHFA